MNVAVGATDLDIKDVTIVADDEGAYGQSFVLSLKNRKWMKQSNFATLLNRMGYTARLMAHHWT